VTNQAFESKREIAASAVRAVIQTAANALLVVIGPAATAASRFNRVRAPTLTVIMLAPMFDMVLTLGRPPFGLAATGALTLDLPQHCALCGGLSAQLAATHLLFDKGGSCRTP